MLSPAQLSSTTASLLPPTPAVRARLAASPPALHFYRALCEHGAHLLGPTSGPIDDDALCGGTVVERAPFAPLALFLRRLCAVAAAGAPTTPGTPVRVGSRRVTSAAGMGVAIDELTREAAALARFVATEWSELLVPLEQVNFVERRRKLELRLVEAAAVAAVAPASSAGRRASSGSGGGGGGKSPARQTPANRAAPILPREDREEPTSRRTTEYSAAGTERSPSSANTRGKTATAVAATVNSAGKSGCQKWGRACWSVEGEAIWLL